MPAASTGAGGGGGGDAGGSGADAGRPLDNGRTGFGASFRRVILAIATFVVVAMIAGAAVAWFHRDDTICADRKLPVKQQDFGMGQIRYQCHNGQIVKK